MHFGVTRMVLKTVILNEVSQTKQDKYCKISLLYAKSLKKMIQMNLFTKQK